MRDLFFILTMIVINLSSQSLLFAQNPIVPPGTFMADPAAHVWPDGKLYVYGSRDESTKYYCSDDHDVLSTDDLRNWKFTRNIFSSDDTAYQHLFDVKILSAPDVQYKNGLYYMYFCTSSKTKSEGVAYSKSPTGPFINPIFMNTYGFNQIDPAVFMDDDGQAYYIWGQFQAKVAKLKPNMMEIDSATIHQNVVTEKEHYFHEGGYMIKRKGIYYFIYAHMGRGGRPTCLGYSTSKSPFGPFKYGGVIIDNDHCDPGNWNNHGSIVKFKGQWYVFYHRSTQGSNTMRKACVEPIHFNEDGSINEVEMTTQGAGPPLDATHQIDAERACIMYGNVRIQPFTSDNEELGEIKNKDVAGYKYINFKDGVQYVEFRVAPATKSSTINICLDQIWHAPIASVKVPANQTKEWITVSAKLNTPVKGVHAVWLNFVGENPICSVDWFRFSSR